MKLETFACGEYLNLEIHGYLIVEAQLLLELDFNKCYTATTNSVTCYHSISTCTCSGCTTHK